MGATRRCRNRRRRAAQRADSRAKTSTEPVSGGPDRGAALFASVRPRVFRGRRKEASNKKLEGSQDLFRVGLWIAKRDCLRGIHEPNYRRSTDVGIQVSLDARASQAPVECQSACRIYKPIAWLPSTPPKLVVNYIIISITYAFAVLFGPARHILWALLASTVSSCFQRVSTG